MADGVGVALEVGDGVVLGVGDGVVVAVADGVEVTVGVRLAVAVRVGLTGIGVSEGVPSTSAVGDPPSSVGRAVGLAPTATGVAGRPAEASSTSR